MTTDTKAMRDLTIRVPEALFNDIELGLAKHTAIEMLRWLEAIRSDVPESHQLLGGSVQVTTTKNRLDIDYHDPKKGKDGNRPKRLRWSISIELDDYASN